MRQISGEIEDCTNASLVFKNQMSLKRHTNTSLMYLLGMYEFGKLLMV
jgi:hypothetical protein